MILRIDCVIVICLYSAYMLILTFIYNAYKYTLHYFHFVVTIRIYIYYSLYALYTHYNKYATNCRISREIK